jgi:D-arginine dehydrogenase
LPFDFIVIGAGMAGVSVADALAGSARVALLESEAHPGYHATGRSAALFAPSYGSATFSALTRASADFLREPPERFAATPVLRRRGALYLAHAAQLASLHAEIEQMRRNGAEVESLSPQEARALVPALRRDYVAAAAYEPDVHDIDVEALFQAFIRRGRTAGVQLFSSTRLGVPHWHHGAWHVPLGQQEIEGRVVINAAGAWADQVAGLFGIRPLGLQVLRRSAAVIDAPPGTDAAGWPAVFDIDEQFYLKPEAWRLLISPADEEPVAPCDAYAEDLTIALAVDRIQSALDIDVVRVHRSWAGLRTFARDRDPVIGYERAVPGFFWCAGQGGYGIQTSPALAQLAAALAQQRPIPDTIAAEGVTALAVDPQRLREP